MYLLLPLVSTLLFTFRAAHGCGSFNNDGERPAEDERCVTVEAFERELLAVANKMTDAKLRDIFLNAAPNTLVRGEMFYCSDYDENHGHVRTGIFEFTVPSFLFSSLIITSSTPPLFQLQIIGHDGIP